LTEQTEQAKQFTWMGAEQLKPLLIPIEEVQPFPGNPRRGNVQAIARSLDTFGQQKPIVVQASTRYVVAGNHTRLGAIENGWTHIAAVVEEMDDETARDYLLADNKSTDDASYDSGELLTMLQSAANSGTLDRTLYTGDDLDDLLATQGGQETEDERTNAEHAPADDRWVEGEEGLQRSGSTGAVREVRLVFDVESYEKFHTNLRILRSEWGTAGLIETVERAVEYSVEQVRGEEEPVTVDNMNAGLGDDT